MTENEKLLEKICTIYDTRIHNIALIEPRAYDITAKPSKIANLSSLPDKTKVMVRGRLSNFRVKSAGRFTFIYADLHDEHHNRQICQWASSNKASHSKMMILQNESNNETLQVVGSITSFIRNGERVIFLSNPKFEKILSKDSSCSLMPSPVYTLKNNTKHFEIKNSIKLTLEKASLDKYAMSYEIEKKLNLPTLLDSLRHIHGFVSISEEQQESFIENSSIYHKRIRYEKIYRILKRLNSDSGSGKSPVIHYNKESLSLLEGTLPYSLTIDQKKVLGEIFEIFAAYTALLSNKQVVVMAPSNVLVTQLFDEYSHVLKDTPFEVLLVTGKTTKKQKEKFQNKINTDVPCVIVGSTAINNLQFNNLGLVVIDKEQKFDIDAKRALLRDPYNLPYMLYMSATPLPRSIQSSIYGNYKIIKIAAKPKGRLSVLTKIIQNQLSVDKLLTHIENESKEGRASLIVAPSIAAGEMASIRKIERICNERFEFSFFKSIHGRLTEKEIEKNIESFKREGVSFIDSNINGQGWFFV